MWYSFKCWAFKRYTTVKPRWLDHTWCDKTTLTPFLMFECLCQFIEKEKPFEKVNWDWCEEHKFARNELIELYTWWICVYIPWFQDQNDYKGFETPEVKAVRKSWAIIDKLDSGQSFFSRLAKGKKGPQESEEAWETIHNIERQMRYELKTHCHRLIEIFDYLWT